MSAGHYVALGDSMSIDDYAGGPGRGAASLLFRNRDRDFPDWRGRDLAARDLDFAMLAQDGATTGGVLSGQLPRVPRPATVCTVSMGGNDLMCHYGDDRTAAAALQRAVANLRVLLVGLRSVAAAATIVVTTVYDPSDGSGVAGPTGGLPPWPNGPALVRELNAGLTAAATEFGAVVADVHAHFIGHGTTAGDPGQADPRPADRDLWYCGVIEPNAWGAHEIRAAWWRALA
jgi:hypothetical protein